MEGECHLLRANCNDPETTARTKVFCQTLRQAVDLPLTLCVVTFSGLLHEHKVLAQLEDLQQLHICCIQNAGAHDQVVACVAEAVREKEQLTHSTLHHCTTAPLCARGHRSGNPKTDGHCVHASVIHVTHVM